jgi:hypothetical protein
MQLTSVGGAIMLVLNVTLAHAQGGPSGRGSITGDPAASSANPGSSSSSDSSSKPNPSGSGTSTSGGSDANADQGRDKMPDDLRGERPVKSNNKR